MKPYKYLALFIMFFNILIVSPQRIIYFIFLVTLTPGITFNFVITKNDTVTATFNVN
jgi:hypothetical protein